MKAKKMKRGLAKRRYSSNPLKWTKRGQPRKRIPKEMRHVVAEHASIRAATVPRVKARENTISEAVAALVKVIKPLGQPAAVAFRTEAGILTVKWEEK